MGNKGKTPRKPIFEMINSQKGSCKLQYNKKVSFMSPQKIGNC